jgi:hypothetical protein
MGKRGVQSLGYNSLAIKFKKEIKH